MRRRLNCLHVAACVAASLLMSAPAFADWRDAPAGFRIGMIETAAPPPAGREALRRAFADVLGMPVHILVLRNWPQLIDAHASGRIEYALYSATGYATASELCGCVEPLAAPLDIDGAAGVRSTVFARPAAAGELVDLRATSVAAGTDDDLTGWMAPKALLAEAGLDFESEAGWLRRAASPGAALELFRDGGAEAIFGWERAAPDGESLQGGTAEQIKDIPTTILWRSPLLRYGPHAVSASLDPEAKSLLMKFLLGLHAGNPQAYDLLSQGHGGGFIAVSEADYDTMRAIVRGTAKP